MSRQEFITATALILFGAFLLGWLVSWMVHRLSRPARPDATELDRMAHQLDDVTERHRAALAELEDREDRLAETEIELTAAMEGLRDSRSEIEELRDYIERALARR